MMLSGILMPSRAARLSELEISSVDAWARVAGVEAGAELKTLYRVLPSGVKALPPTFWTVLNEAFAVELSGKGRLLTLCCAITPSDPVSYSVNPAMKRDPSGAIERMVDWPVTVRLRRMEDDAGS